MYICNAADLDQVTDADTLRKLAKRYREAMKSANDLGAHLWDSGCEECAVAGSGEDFCDEASAWSRTYIDALSIRTNTTPDALVVRVGELEQAAAWVAARATVLQEENDKLRVQLAQQQGLIGEAHRDGFAAGLRWVDELRATGSVTA